ncbi:MAG: N-acetylmuramoyl-L-alanine amidase [Myxococcaceae bacterium]
MFRSGSLLASAALAALLLAAPAWARELVVVIDPGHGGDQQGAEGPEGTLEKDVALQLAKKLREELKKELGARVLLTRERDTDLHLSERVAWANRRRPDLFISLHANSMPTHRLRQRVQGIETYFLSANASGADAASTADRENAEGPAVDRTSRGDTLAFILDDLQRAEAHVDSSRLAYAVHQKLIEHTRAEDRGVQQAPFYVLNGLDAPAILVEIGYISHPTEGPKLKTSAYQVKLVRALSEGVSDFVQQIGARDGEKLATPQGQ